MYNDASLVFFIVVPNLRITISWKLKTLLRAVCNGVVITEMYRTISTAAIFVNYIKYLPRMQCKKRHQ